MSETQLTELRKRIGLAKAEASQEGLSLDGIDYQGARAACIFGMRMAVESGCIEQTDMTNMLFFIDQQLTDQEHLEEIAAVAV